MHGRVALGETGFLVQVFCAVVVVAHFKGNFAEVVLAGVRYNFVHQDLANTMAPKIW